MIARDRRMTDRGRPMTGPALPTTGQDRLMTGLALPMIGQVRLTTGRVLPTTAFDYRFGAGKSGNS